jgi:putative colanic acid biosynthesis acetyltransferase WcaF
VLTDSSRSLLNKRERQDNDHSCFGGLGVSWRAGYGEVRRLGAELCPESGEGIAPVIDRAKALGAGETWDRHWAVVYAWRASELLLVSNPWQISSRLRVAVLRAFGAEIGAGVTFRPRTRVCLPWKLHIGSGSWIGEGVWFHNQDDVFIGSNAVISQECFITTGSHRARSDMGLITRPVRIDDGAWVTSRCMVLGGAHIGQSAVVEPLTVVRGTVPPNAVYGRATGPAVIRERFRESDSR